MTECCTVSISIQRAPDEVYNYLLDVASFPQWSAFITKIEPEGAAWRATTPRGTIRLQFEPRNTYRVLDHTVTTLDGKRIFVAMRVLPNGADASEVTVSLFRQPEMSDDEFAADGELVRIDLASLKNVLEN